MARILWINPALGVAGDMLLGGLLDVGADETLVRESLDGLGVTGWDLRVSTVHRRTISCLKADVTTEETQSHRSWSSIDALLAGSRLEESVTAGARRTFALLADVEAERHGIARDEVRFHEVGAVDAIIDIVGCWAAIETIDIEAVHSAAPGLGVGTVQSAHGLLAHPAPATLALLQGVPIRGVDTAIETTTPTGAALLVTMVDHWGPVPSGTLLRTGYGAGDSDPSTHANILAIALVGQAEAADVEAMLVETNVDDVTPEMVGHLIDRALAEGADDAWVVPIVMKKSRPGHQIRILCSPAIHEHIADLILRETGTLGLRSYPVTKQVLARRVEQVEVAGEVVRIKVGPHGAKPESADVFRIAEAIGESARWVSAEAVAAWTAKQHR